jgi:amino acid transporter
MQDKRAGGMSAITICMIIFVTTFGLSNVINSLVTIGLSAVPSWTIVGVVYFLPLALILAEFASDTSRSGGIYSYMERGLGARWAFIGTWTYFVSNMVYLQTSFSTFPIRVSLALTGADVFADLTVWLPFIGVGVCLMVTLLAVRGVRWFSGLANVVGQAVLVLVGILILVPFVMVLSGHQESATPLAHADWMPAFDLDYFATFSWLLFAVAGAEVAAPYVNQVANPVRDFPLAIVVSTLLIAGVYVLATISVAMVYPLGSLTLATGLYDIWARLGDMLGITGTWFATLCMSVIVVGFLAAFVVWAESPIRAMFTELPRGSFPDRLLTRDDNGTLRFALWAQAAVVSLLILVPLLSILTGMRGSDAFMALLNDMVSLALVVPYVFIALAYIRARRNGMDAPFKMVRSTPLAVAIAGGVVLVSVAGYLGAGLYALQAEQIDWVYVGTIYGGPAVLTLFGLLVRRLSHHTSS